MRKLFLAGLLVGASILAPSDAASACDEWYGYDDSYYGYAAPRVYAYVPAPRVYAYTPGPRVYGYTYYGYGARGYTENYYYGPDYWGTRRRW
jgi:hypothetical protein